MGKPSNTSWIPLKTHQVKKASFVFFFTRMKSQVKVRLVKSTKLDSMTEVEELFSYSDQVCRTPSLWRTR